MTTTKSSRNSRLAAIACLALTCAATTESFGQNVTLQISPIQYGRAFNVSISNALNNAEWFLAADAEEGNFIVPELGNLVIGLGLTESFTDIAHSFTDGVGNGQMTLIAAFDPSTIGYQAFAQAFSFDPTEPTKIASTNVWKTVMHPPTAGNGTQNTLTLTDDGTVLVPLPFNFPFFSSSYTEMYVNANGTISFGSSELLATPAAGDLTTGPAHLAPLWTDLDPEFSGFVTTDETGIPGFAFRVRYSNIMDNVQTGGANTFEVTLYSGGHIQIEYGSVGVTQALVGIAPASAVLGAPVDLSAPGVSAFDINTPIYEPFTSSSHFDLANDLLTFVHFSGYGYVLLN